MDLRIDPVALKVTAEGVAAKIEKKQEAKREAEKDQGADVDRSKQTLHTTGRSEQFLPRGGGLNGLFDVNGHSPWILKDMGAARNWERKILEEIGAGSGEASYRRWVNL